jgi:hypothetical protein
MARNVSLPYQFPPVMLLAPAADAAGRTSPYRTLKNALKAWIVVHVNQGNAAQVTLTPLQAQDVAGTGSKAINAVPIWLNADTSLSDAYAVQAAAASLQTSAATKDKIVIFEITPDVALDVANGFRTIGVSTNASNAANITEAKLFVLEGMQGASAPSTYTN